MNCCNVAVVSPVIADDSYVKSDGATLPSPPPPDGVVAPSPPPPDGVASLLYDATSPPDHVQSLGSANSILTPILLRDTESDSADDSESDNISSGTSYKPNFLYPIVCSSINITFDTELWSELCASPG